jgi:hypothetical protein
MRPAEFEWHDCIAPIPTDACTGFDEARGEFRAYPTGRCETSRRYRASHIRKGRAGKYDTTSPKLPLRILLQTDSAILENLAEVTRKTGFRRSKPKKVKAQRVRGGAWSERG